MAAAGIAAAVGVAGRDFTILAGTASPALGAAIAQELGVPVGACDIARYPDGEVAVQLRESVRRKEVFLVQSTAPPVDEHLVELLALADACRRAVALRITAIMPYFGYGRSDKRSGRREPIMGHVVADVLQAVGTGHVVTVDLHTPQIEGFFHAPVDGLTAVPTLCDAMRGRLPRDVVVVSPDAGRVRLASTYARCLGAPVVVLHKRRESATQTAVTHVVGEVAGRACLLVDDMISTGATVASGIAALLAAGARPEIVVAATHGLFVAGTGDRLRHPALRHLFVTDTVGPGAPPNTTVVSVAPLIAAAVERVLADGAVGDIY